MKFTIKIDRLKVFAYIGVMHAEKVLGNHFEVTTVMNIDIPDDKAGNDDITSTVNYSRVVEIIQDVMKQSCDLLETAALRIAREVFKLGATGTDYTVLNVTVTVTKLNPPIPNTVMEGASATVSVP
ncbi:MAG: dihydroneopterin aldolase [Muribaculaceae bacterium]|nr:dihydroneopterin aldolase [Muribaculaceae bacterium]